MQATQPAALHRCGAKFLRCTPHKMAVPGRFQVPNPGGTFQIYHSRFAASVKTAIPLLSPAPHKQPVAAQLQEHSVADRQTGPSL